MTATPGPIKCSTNEETEAERLIGILAEALEDIVDATSDPTARALATEALAIFHGR